MANEDSTREFHDELLSAYLDGELSPAERRVDERLAVDPVARQMLDELRSVSLALQSLPHEKLGEDLRPAILERTQQAAPITAPLVEPTASPASARFDSLQPAGGLSRGSSGPAFTIGRTRRGWVWAAVAVAAALVIMFVERDKERDAQLPSVASNTRDESKNSKTTVAHDDSSVRERQELSNAVAGSGRDDIAQSGREVSGELVSTLPSAPPATTPMLTAPARTMPEPILDGMARGGESERLIAEKSLGVMFDDKSSARDNVAQPGDKQKDGLAEGLTRENADGRFVTEMEKRVSDASTVAGATPSADKRPAAEAVVSGEVLGGAPAVSQPADAKSNLTSSRENFLIVYVDVKREALQNRTIDRQLASNGIVLDTTTTQPALFQRARRDDGLDAYYSTLEANGRYDELALRLKLAQPSETDAILIEAQPAQVDGLLAALDADSDNVVGISIDELKSSDSSTQASQLALVDWSKFKRVVLPEELRELSRQSGQRSSQVSNGSNLLAMDTEPVASARRGRGGGRGRGAAPIGGQARGGGGGGGGGRGGRAPVSGQAAAGQPVPANQANEAVRGTAESTTSTPSAGDSTPAKDSGQVAAAGDVTSGSMPAGLQQQRGGVANFGGRGADSSSGRTDSGAGTAPSNTSGFGGVGAGGEAGNSNRGFGGGGFGGGMQAGFGADRGQFGDNFGTRGSPTAGENGSFYGRQLTAGRAWRFVIAPQGEAATRLPATSSPDDDLYRLYVKRDDTKLDGDRDGNEAVVGAPAAAARPTEVATAQAGSPLGQSPATRAAAASSEPQPRGGRSVDDKRGEDIKAVDNIAGGTPAGSSTAAAADQRYLESGGVRRGETPTTSQSAATSSLHVLFLFRVQPASAAAPATDAAGKPAASPAAADKAK